VSRFELAEHETSLLLQAARTVDLLHALQALIDRDGPVVPPGEGTRANPAVVEARAHRIVLARLVASLGIPASEDEGRVAPRGRARGVYNMRAMP
jgi:hypothetical protein